MIDKYKLLEHEVIRIKSDELINSIKQASLRKELVDISFQFEDSNLGINNRGTILSQNSHKISGNEIYSKEIG